GVGAFFAEKYAKPRYEKWTSLPKTTRLELVKRERDSILRYQLWKTIYTQLFGVPITVLRPRQGTEVDGKSNGTCAESPEHRKLKEWVARNPQRIGLPTQFGKGKTEVCLPSGDEVDVLFEYGMRFATVEVKSCRS